jgi:hypothetical protein
MFASYDRHIATSDHMYINWILFFNTLLLCSLTESCLRSSSSSQSQQQTSTASQGSRGSVTPEPEHRLPCSSSEQWAANCLNGGTCFVVILVGNRNVFCSCTSEWIGKHCESRYIDPLEVQQSSTNVTIVLAVIIPIVVLAIVVVIIVFCVRHRRQNRPDNKSNAAQQQGAEPQSAEPPIYGNGFQPYSYHDVPPRSMKVENGFHDGVTSLDYSHLSNPSSELPSFGYKRHETSV